MEHVDLPMPADMMAMLVPQKGLTGNAEAGSNRYAAAAPATVSGEVVLDTPLVHQGREGERRRRSASQETCQHTTVRPWGGVSPEVISG
jgi:hypothetical protein